MNTGILIVDDAAFMRMMMKDILTRNGFVVCAEAENGQIALSKYKEIGPDLVIMDITMPEMNGIEALKGIKAENPNAKVIMCSALGQQDMVVEAIQYGALDFIVKPFHEDRIVKAINKIFEG